MKFNEMDTVVLLRNYPDQGIKRGDIGVVVEVYTTPTEAYEVEFCDDEGRTIAQMALPPEELDKFAQ